jgi:7-carboxy-7-deazaguanine synthase (Cx14CxxC type)
LNLGAQPTEMSYAVKEIFFSLQGEGARAGRPAVFCRFSGCNLWSGRERDRGKATCRFCDTDFVGTDGRGGGTYHDAASLAAAVAAAWPEALDEAKYVICTGGEPLLQLDPKAVTALRGVGFAVAIETNGTLTPPAGLDWICVSPKAGVALRQSQGDELKLVFPQAGAPPELYEPLAFTHFFLQPMDGPDRDHNTAMAVSYCLRRPRWRLSLQTHKLLGLP